MCLWVSYKGKYGKIIVFLHPFCTASYWQSCGAQIYDDVGHQYVFPGAADPDPDPDPDPDTDPRF
jgi:hypothetical protein